MKSEKVITLGEYVFICVLMYGLGALGGAMVMHAVLR